MMGVFFAYTPGTLSPEFRLIVLNGLRKGSYIGSNRQQPQEALAPTTIRSRMC